MYHKPSVPRSIGGVLDDTMQLYKAAFSRCLVPALLMGIAAALLSFYQVSRLPVTASGGTDLQALLARGMATTPTSMLLSLVALLIELVFYAVMIHIIAAVSGGEAPTVGESFSASIRRLPANIGATLLVAIAGVIGTGVAMVPFFIALAGNPRGAALPEIAARMGPAILVCFVLAIPVIYVVSRMLLYMVPLVAERQGPLRSIATSWRLVGGNWWRTSTVLFVMAIIVYVLTIVVVGIAGAIGLMVTGIPTAPGQALGTVAVIGALMGGAIRIVSAPLMSALFVSIYHDLVLRKGGGDLEARLGALPKG
jgi:hypothetical protein